MITGTSRIQSVNQRLVDLVVEFIGKERFQRVSLRKSFVCLNHLLHLHSHTLVKSVCADGLTVDVERLFTG